VAQCAICGSRSDEVSASLGLCARCILADTGEARAQAAGVHERSRQRFGLPAQPPRDESGAVCRLCANACRIGEGEVGYCGARRNEDGLLVGGDADAAAVSWYHDPLPTNCVADWVCPASGDRGYTNLAVFYEACSFDCLFCQNWHYKHHSISGPRRSASELAAAADERTRCICFFGGDPTCQVEHALAAVRQARARAAGRTLRICWETNGSMARSALEEMAELSLESGGCVKFDLKAWDDSLHRALCGASNRATLANFEHLAGWTSRRPDPPLLIASTLLVPGYIEAKQVGRIAAFLARLDRSIPYALLAFHPCFEMKDLPTTPPQQALDCLAAAESAGLTRVRVGNIHLLA